MDPRTAFVRRDELQMIDVREPFEWQAGHIEGAQHIPMGEIQTRLDEIDDGKPLLAICRSGNRSGHVVRFLRRKGFQIENLDGGMGAWMKTGLPVAGVSARPGRVV